MAVAQARMGVFAEAETSIGLYDKQKRHGQSAPWRRIGSGKLPGNVRRTQ